MRAAAYNRAMRPELDPHEARVIGCLIEKQITTPDQYPLSLNALASACNQKSNRDPVLALEDAAVQQVVDRLSRKHLLFEKSGFGSRVPKYQQCFCNTEFASLKFTPQETAIVCELLLRGPEPIEAGFAAGLLDWAFHLDVFIRLALLGLVAGVGAGPPGPGRA